MISRTARSSLQLVLIAFAASIVTACNDAQLDRVQKLAAQSGAIQVSFSKIAIDQYDSCVRGTRYFVLGVGIGGITKRTQSERKCEKFNAPRQQQLENANQILVDYLVALGAVAGNQQVDYGPEIASLKGSLASVLPEKSANAGAKIVDVLLDIFQRSYRRETLRDVIINSDSGFQQYIAGLRTIVESGYQGVLNSERGLVDDYYEEFIRPVLKKNDHSNDRELLNLDEAWRSRLKIIDEQRALARVYVRLLDKIALTHNKLAQAFGGTQSDAASVTLGCDAKLGKCKEMDEQALASVRGDLDTLSVLMDELAKTASQAKGGL